MSPTMIEGLSLDLGWWSLMVGEMTSTAGCGIIRPSVAGDSFLLLGLGGFFLIGGGLA